MSVSSVRRRVLAQGSIPLSINCFNIRHRYQTAPWEPTVESVSQTSHRQINQAASIKNTFRPTASLDSILILKKKIETFLLWTFIYATLFLSVPIILLVSYITTSNPIQLTVQCIQSNINPTSLN